MALAALLSGARSHNKLKQLENREYLPVLCNEVSAQLAGGPSVFQQHLSFPFRATAPAVTPHICRAYKDISAVQTGGSQKVQLPSGAHLRKQNALSDQHFSTVKQMNASIPGGSGEQANSTPLFHSIREV